MKNFIISYYGEPPAEARSDMAKFGAWMKGLGEALISPGNPVGRGKVITTERISDDTKVNRLVGYSIIKAENLEAAVEMAKDCPHKDYGPVEVAETFEINM